ncbi:family 2 encapsulin nanocompartment cargo protein polyprenyl transferase [Kitasatospora paracochleata]|uniref:Geranylgeranyl diphosphate synthase type I n=1 Tax=Kitasatospora paracochleata TaxID=58354 RepID=A0ABT1J8E9_9ACTN|nr:polyprenyl synthetase family protein [Kitasatospora paracochleata]MCP2313668.1 geranylgeranyl diphosphate synthase type I [Kitasatospora paracochleata]
MQTVRTSQQITQDVIAYMEPALRDAVARLDEPVRRMTEYHFGWVDTEGRPTAPVGFRRRPALVALLCAGSRPEDWDPVRTAAVAGTLMSAAGTVHDDIIDREMVRKGRATLWNAFGGPAAIQVGVALHCLAFELLAEKGDPVSTELIRLAAVAIRECSAGQVRDLESEGTSRMSLEHSLELLESTIALPTAGVCLAGALVRGADPDGLAAAERFGYHAGMAMAFYDDWEGIWGTARDDLEDPLADLRRRKSRAFAAFALQAAGPARDQLAAFYDDTAEPTLDRLRQVADLIEECGGRTWLEARIREHIALAHAVLSHTVPDPVAQAELAAFVAALADDLP